MFIATKAGSMGAKALSAQLGAMRILPDSPTFKGRGHKTIINWGQNKLGDEHMKCKVVNNPSLVCIAQCKLKSMIAFSQHDVKVPDWTVDHATAVMWADEDCDVVCRTLLNASGGRGIVIAECGDDVVDAPLYVKYMKKKSEFRVHIVAGNTILLQRKVRGPDANPEKINWRVRSHDNGFIFQRNDVHCSGKVSEQAYNAMKALGLDFGAVDVIYNERNDEAYVLEVNTAPGLGGSTVEDYANAFHAMEEDRKL